MSSGPEELYNLVRQIPYGRICSYGRLGATLTNRVSGLVAGKWMERCPEDLPWWRVVAADGRLVIAKKNALAGQLQRTRLEEEGVLFDGDLVRVREFFWEPV